MRKSKILGIALAAAMVSSIAATAAFSASASVTSDGIDGETVGICGAFTNWGIPDAETGKVIEDIPMTNNNGVWEGTIEIAEVTEAMLGEPTMDDGTGKQVPRTDITGKAISFKVRTNNSWTNSWGEYEAAYVRTNNSQTNCAVPAEAGKPITIKVKLDTTTTVAESEIPADDGDAWTVWPVTYEVVASAPAEESKEEESSEAPAEESKEEESKAEESKEEESTKPAEEPSEDSKPVETGDAASAAALVAVVLASLGTAVVMTKKASAKD